MAMSSKDKERNAKKKKDAAKGLPVKSGKKGKKK